MAITLLGESGRQAGGITDAGIGLVIRPDGKGAHVAVTAIVTREKILRLISWRVSHDGRAITRLADSGDHAGESHLVDLARSGSHVVSAVKDSDDNLKLIVWAVNDDTGAISRTGDTGHLESEVKLVSMTESPRNDGNVIVALAGKSDRLAVKNYAISSAGHITRVGDSIAEGQASGQVSALALCAGDESKVITAVRESHGNLKLIVWKIEATGHVKRVGDSGDHAGEIHDVDVCRSVKDHVVTAVRDSGHDLKLIVWSVAPDGAVARVGDSGTQAGGADHIAILDLPATDSPATSTRQLLTAVRTREMGLKLIQWKIAASGTVTRLDDFSERTPPVDQIEIASDDADLSVVALRSRDDKRLVLASFSRHDAPQPTVAPENLILHDTAFFENTAQLMPPSTSAVRGRIVVHLGQPRSDAGFVFRDLFDANQVIAPNLSRTKVNYPLDATIQTNATDNQLIRLADGGLLAIKNGYTWADLSPQPAWFDKVSIKNQTSQRARNAVFVLHSDDGAAWTLRSVIDAAVVFGGKYGWPQNDGTGGVGGFDRTELYQDPFTGHLFVSGKGDGGPFTKAGATISNHKKVILRSTDGGFQWKGIAELDGGLVFMASTKTFPLVAFQAADSDLTFSLLAQGASSLGPALQTAIMDGDNAITIATDPGMDDLRQSPRDMCRIGDGDRVRISVPTLNASGRQVYEICNVALSPTSVALDRITRIEARDPTKQSCFLGSFVHDNASTVGTGLDAALFYWVEGPPKTASPNDLVARFRLFRGEAGQFVTGTLSVTSGQLRTFARTGIGDYMKGGSVAIGSKRHFLAQWVETTRIAGNVVTIPL